jgi:uncharacterized protein DUF222
VADGSISGEHARVLAEAVWRLPDDPRLPSALEQAVLPPLAGRCVTVSQFRRRVRRAAMRLDPMTAEQRHQRALADRMVGYLPGEDGLAGLSVVLGAPEAQLIYTRLTAAATILPADDPRTMDQKRADLFVDAVLSGLPVDGSPMVRGRRPAIQVVVSADTLLGLDDQPAHLTGYGPITAQAARRLAADESGTWRRLLTDPDTGALLDIGKHRYRPAQRLRDFVAARDDVRVPDLQPTGLPLRVRAHQTVHRGRFDLSGQRGAGLSPAQPMQAQHRLELPAQPRRLVHLDQQHRPPLHRHYHHRLEHQRRRCWPGRPGRRPATLLTAPGSAKVYASVGHYRL